MTYTLHREDDLHKDTNRIATHIQTSRKIHEQRHIRQWLTHCTEKMTYIKIQTE